MARSRTVWRNGKLFAEYADGQLTYLSPEYRAPNRSDAVAAPMIMRDIGEYKSPIDNQMITSRSQHREHLKVHDVIEVGNERMPPRPTEPALTREVGEAIKRRLDEVQALPQREYEAHVQQQQAEHAAISSLVTASEAA